MGITCTTVYACGYLYMCVCVFVCMGMSIYAVHTHMYHTYGRCKMKSPDQNGKYGENMSDNERNHAADDSGLKYRLIDDVLCVNPFI